MLGQGIDHQGSTGNSLDLFRTKVRFYPIYRADTIVKIKNAVKKVLVKLHKICEIHGSTMQEGHFPPPSSSLSFLFFFPFFDFVDLVLPFKRESILLLRF